MIPGILAWAAAALLCFIFLRKTRYNFGDPLVFINVSIPFSAALLAVLCASGLVDFKKLGLFFIVLAAFLVGARTATAFFGREEFRRALNTTVARLSKTELNTILTSATLCTLAVAVFAIQTGGQGDARQAFSRAFRPLVTLQAGLFLFSLLALLSPKLSSKQVVAWFVVLICPSIAFSGKSVFLPVFYWFGLLYFARSRRANVMTVLGLIMGVFLGVGLMGVVAYGVGSTTDAFFLLSDRLWLSGDVYIYAYQLDALSMIRGEYHVSFASYMLHPITSLFGLRGYEKPLGSMLMSAVKGEDVLTGPNPQLPVLLDYFFPNQMMVSIAISYVVGLFTIGTRAVGLRLADSRSKYLSMGGVTAAVFCPATGFVDTSQVLILMIGIAATSGIGALLSLIVTPRRCCSAAPASVHPLS